MRAQWHDAARLRRLADDAKRNAEKALTAELAMYLHDQGLNPLTQAMVGGLEPDLLDPASRWTFYTEAKQYKDKSPRTYLIRGVHQVWDTLGRMRGTPYEVHEAFYLVFRRSGPRVVFPDQIHAEGVTIYPVLVDIAEAAQSGSKQKHQPVTIYLEDLLPTKDR